MDRFELQIIRRKITVEHDRSGVAGRHRTVFLIVAAIRCGYRIACLRRGVMSMFIHRRQRGCVLSSRMTTAMIIHAAGRCDHTYRLRRETAQ